MRLAKKGELLTHHKDKAVLTLLKMDSVIEKDFIEVHPNMSLGDMVKVISQSHRNIFPVTDNDNTLLGIVILDDIRNIMFRPELYNRFYVRKFMTMPPAKIEIGSNMDNVMKLFDQTNAWNLPVVENGKYIGFVSKSKIFNSYRRYSFTFLKIKNNGKTRFTHHLYGYSRLRCRESETPCRRRIQCRGCYYHA